MFNLYMAGSSSRQMCDMFSVEYPDRPILNKNTVLRIVATFNKTGCLNPQHTRRNSVRLVMDEDKQFLILTLVEENHNLSVRQIAEQTGVSATSIYKLLKKGGYKSYKYSNHQELLPRDFEQRMLFSERMFNKINSDEGILHEICFTDEATFTVTSEVNSQNCRYWSQENLFSSAYSQCI